ncbi:hypothetical protein BJ085DRAFT_39686 [Dimargaris cristalligena]|uniref:Uncharacterized protein n=1 Tax=Dimargaris cristalligena TaxID=215637 RepID=A0A4P9ZJU1_9FUNG|nr:hypothetical protein BJ085DRAFT_39686 [Dimargaris cristalligena]|eukprot:RKP33335.1 hypothetical protein BJ085DRAFT_39686 [Dimargaris cristalligena]
MDAAVASPVGPFTQVASLVGQPGDALVALSETPHRLAERLGQILPPLTARLDQATPSAEASDPSSSEITLGLDTIVHDLNGHDRGLKRFLALLEEKLSASHADRERLVTHLTAQLEEGKASQRLHALTHEQELHHLERQNQQYQAALTKANARLTALEKDLAAALQASHQHRDILAQRDTQNDELREQIQKLQQRLERAEVDKNERAEQLDQRLQEIERVENRCNELSAQLAEAKNAAALNETHIQEAKYNETTAKIQLASKEQELHLLQRNNEPLHTLYINIIIK